MNRNEAKDMFRNDKDSYGKPKGIMSKIDKIYDEFDLEVKQLKLEIENGKKISINKKNREG